jgi:SAM-dependent methyltransferase
MPNEDQAAHWAGAGGDLWAAQTGRHDRMLAPFTDDLLAALDLRPGERVLDVGCGTGALTWAVAGAVAPGGRVVGIDLSPQLLARARSRGTDDGVRFIEADAQTTALAPPFDAWTSRFGVMFFDDPPVAFANLVGALRPGGRVAFSCWQEPEANDWQRVPAEILRAHVPVRDRGPGPGPYAFADPERLRALLAGAGLTDIVTAPAQRDLWLGDSGDDACEFLMHTQLVRVALADSDAPTVERVRAELAAALDAYGGAHGVVVGSAVWLVTGHR